MDVIDCVSSSVIKREIRALVRTLGAWLKLPSWQRAARLDRIKKRKIDFDIFDGLFSYINPEPEVL